MLAPRPKSQARQLSFGYMWSFDNCCSHPESRIWCFEWFGARIRDTELSIKAMGKRSSKATKRREKWHSGWLKTLPWHHSHLPRCSQADVISLLLLPSQPVAALLQVFDELLRDAFSVIAGLSVPDLAWTQSSLTIKDGDFGVQQDRDQHITAFLGSSCQSAHLVSFLTECVIADTPEFVRASNDFREQSGSAYLSSFTQETFQEKLE